MSAESVTKSIDTCATINKALGTSIEWIGEVRETATSLDRVADTLVEDLRRWRNRCRRLGQAVARPVSIGIFGMSQGGKSFLVDSLARGRNGRLESRLGRTTLDFMKHVNPPGGGKEATGLVTRFTCSPSEAPNDFPVEVGLLSEPDVIKVLWNSFMNDFNQETLAPNYDPANLANLLTELRTRKRARPVPGMSVDDVVDLMDYFQRMSRRSQQQLRGNYWPSATELAPYLDAADRAKLFGVLWGEVPALTRLYLNLQSALASVGHSAVLYCELGALVEAGPNGDWVQANCINNVDILKLLDSDGGDELRVLAKSETGATVERRIRRGYLAALTTELRFILTERPEAEVLEKVDLLDLPGYRGRLVIDDVSEIRAPGDDRESGHAASELWLRGKVGFLFERYTEDQEMNLLILCAPSNKQSDVNTMGAVLDTWVKSTQGADAITRSRRPPGLLIVTTMWDLKLQPSANETPEILEVMADNVIHLVLERFKSLDWIANWDGKPFNNLFLVRKPGVPSILFAQENGRETGIAPAQAARMEKIRGYYMASREIARHVQEPGPAWDAMLAPNDGGIGRVIDYLKRCADPEYKHQRIAEQIAALAADFMKLLSVYYRGDASADVEVKVKRAQEIIAALTSEDYRHDRFSELLNAMLPDAEQCRSSYLRIDSQMRDPKQPGEAKPKLALPSAGTLLSQLAAKGLMRSKSADQAAKPAPATSDQARRFANAVTSSWLAQLRDIPRAGAHVRYLSISPQIAETLVEEILAGALRLAVPTKIAEACNAAEEVAAKRRTQFVDEQALIATRVISDYVLYLGVTPDKAPTNILVEGRRVFETEPPIEGIPQFNEERVGTSRLLFITDWLTALKQLIVDNAGFQEGSEISYEQNQKLGEIMNLVSQAARA
jgi:hypothetical protein